MRPSVFVFVLCSLLPSFAQDPAISMTPAEPAMSAVPIPVAVDNSAQIAAERRHLDAERRALAPRSWRDLVPPFLRNARQQLASEKLETVRQKAEVVQNKSAALRTKQEVYETMSAIIEHKISLLNTQRVPLSALDEELERLAEHFDTAGKRQRSVATRQNKTSREIAALEQQLDAHKILEELKPDDRAILHATAQTRRERRDALASELHTLNDRHEMYAQLLRVIGDSRDALAERRAARLKSTLLHRAPWQIDPIALLVWLAATIGLTGVSRLLPRFESWIRRREETRSWLWTMISRIVLYGGFGTSALYALTTLAGYQALAHYVAVRLLRTGGVLLGGALLHLAFAQTVRLLCARYWRRSAESLRTTVRLITTVSGWGLSLYLALRVIRIWGKGTEDWTIIRTALEYPLLTFKAVQFSPALLLKAGFIFWAFVTGARVLNNFLQTRIFPMTRFDEGVRYTFAVGVRYTLTTLGAIVGLESMGLNLSALTVLAGTVGIGVGLGMQEIAKNFISGLVMLIERPVKVGDFIDIGGLPGRVQAIKARSTIVDTSDNISVLIPNAQFMTEKVINWSYGNRLLRIVNPIGVAYGTDVELVKRTLLAAAEHPLVIKHPEPIVHLSAFGDSSMNFSLAVWTVHQEERGNIRSDINFAIERLFREAGIQIPFPQREVRVTQAAIT